MWTLLTLAFQMTELLYETSFSSILIDLLISCFGAVARRNQAFECVHPHNRE